ncbi:DUF5959 family protein [Streptomyces sp. IBSBF 3352]|uniref:DUF5959 family protein n=1 Tax=Streptomyces sp. IBSBF 3352 TaxID=2903523 RepID=UPI002FDC778D
MVDLIHLSDGDNSFRVRVLGRRMPGVLPLHDLLDAEVRVQALDREHGTPTVHVEDVARSGISVSIPLSLEDGWIHDQRKRLRLVRRKWPSEVLKTSPGAYEWRR